VCLLTAPRSSSPLPFITQWKMVVVLLFWSGPWPIGLVACLLDALWFQSFASAGSEWPHSALWYHYLMPLQRLWSTSDCKSNIVCSAVAITQTFFFPSFLSSSLSFYYWDVGILWHGMTQWYILYASLSQWPIGIVGWKEGRARHCRFLTEMLKILTFSLNFSKMRICIVEPQFSDSEDFPAIFRQPEI